MVDPLKVLWVLTNSTYLVSKFIRLGATDKNEHTPYFEKGVFEVDIEENEEINHPILTVAATDRKDTSRVRYEITRGNIGGVFALSSKTGVLYVAGPLDYEQVKRYELRLAASDRTTASFATVIVHVKDVNDNPPTFERPTYRTQITEEDDRNLPKKVLQVVAADLDNERPREIIYSLTGQGVDSDNPINNKFDIGRTTGEIFVLKPLNRDAPLGRPQWRFTVFAQDEGGEGLVGYADVQVNLKDINDNAPAFLQGVYYANVTENSTAGESVMTMSAVDYDDPEEGGNADIVYSIEKNVVEEETGLPIFEIDPETGSIRTAVCCLDRERTPDYVIQVVAVDGGGLKGTGTASIKVADVNDMSPRFSKDEWVTEVDETDGEKLPELPILTVTVHDDDENNDFYYRVVEGSGYGADKFEIVRNPDGTGGLRVIKPLDYEEQTRNSPIRFKIEVKDTGKDSADDPYHMAAAWITVKLRDINDNYPQIDRSNESVQVEEDARVGTILETFRAKDLDQRGKSKVSFRIDRASDPGRLFAISQDGVVTTQRPLDRETTPRHLVRILAVDDGSPSRTSTALLSVTVLDVNDNAPVFASDYRATVMEGDSARVVATLAAVDADNYTSGHGPPFSFRLDPAASDVIKAAFRVDQRSDEGKNTALVTSLQSFDREEQKVYLVPILIQDGGQPPMTGTSTLTVVIGDLNDNLMTTGYKDIFVYNYMGQMPDSEIGAVFVNDPDDWDVLDKTVSWDGPDHRNFRLREDTGMITLRQGTPDGTYLLNFKVFDRRHVQTDVLANVTITVKEIPYQAVSQASSIRIVGLTDEDFIRIPDTTTQLTAKSKAQLFREKMAELLEVADANVDVVSVRLAAVDPPAADVWYSAHSGGQYLNAVRLQGTALLHWTEIESFVGVNVSMVGVSECLQEGVGGCGGSCTNTVVVGGAAPLLVDANSTALVGVSLGVRPTCTCGARDFTDDEDCSDKPCYNGGRCRQNKYGYKCTCGRGLTGPRCQERARSFRGGGWSWFPSLEPCESSHLSFEFVTRKPDGQLLYNGPVVPTKPGEEKLSDYISLELTRGNPRLLIDFGSGTLELHVQTRKGLNDGEWHRLDVLWKKQEVTLIVDFCRTAAVNETEDGSSSTYDDSSCQVSGVTPNFNEYLNLNTPLQLGGRHTLPLDPTLFQWKAVPYGTSFDGCIRNVFHNSRLYDLGSPGLTRGSAPGCPQAAQLCSRLHCGPQGLCEASLSDALCQCLPGFTGPSCATATTPTAFRPHSYVKYALSFEPDRFSSRVQLRFRTRQHTGELFRTTDQHNREYAVLEIVEGKLRFRFNLNGAATAETEVWLLSLAVTDGQWHAVSAWRHGCSVLLSVDGGEGKYYNETIDTTGCSHHWLAVDKQEGVYAGGKAEYTGVRTFEVHADYHSGCLDDVRLDGRSLPLPPAMNGTQWGQATMARNLERGCPSNNSCAAEVCLDPFQCIDLWHEFECSCGEGRIPTADGRDCVDENECMDNPCRNGGVCINQEPRVRYRCICPAGFLGKNCDVIQERQTVKLGMGALATILGCLVFILMLVLLIVIYNRRRESPVKKPRPEDDIRENIISYNDEGGGEDDMTAFDISPLQVPISASSTEKTEIIALTPMSEEKDWGPSLAACRERADADVSAPPFDDLRNYAYEGGGSISGSLSSLLSESDDSQQFDQLGGWGPKFTKLSVLYQKPETTGAEETEEDNT